MKSIKLFAAVLAALFICGVSSPARAQVNNGGGGQQPVTQQQIQDAVRQLATDLQDPSYDYSKVPARMQQLFTDFRQLASTMDPQAAQQLMQDSMTQLGPILQQNQDKLQKAFQLAFINDLQQPMGCSDAEFAAIRPYLEKVAEAQRELQGATNRFRLFGFGGPGGGGPGGRGGPGGGGGGFFGGGQSNQPPTAIQQALTELTTALDDPNSSSDLVASKLAALRLAKDRANQELTQARTELQALLTVRQEAVLLTSGLLD